MDGGRRLLRSVNGLGPALAAPRAVFVGAPSGAIFEKAAPIRSASSRERHHRFQQNDGQRQKIARLLGLPGLGLGLTVALFATVGYYGANQNGQYAQFVRDYGHPRDMVARTLGFGLGAVTITGQTELSEQQNSRGGRSGPAPVAAVPRRG